LQIGVLTLAIPGQFKVGNPGGPGRPAGSKDEKWKSIQALWDELQKLMPSLTPAKKAEIYMRIIELHAKRIFGQLPDTPEQSVENAKKAFQSTLSVVGLQILDDINKPK
jgi:hypothetical protein